jgi:hypothetical protein
LSLLQQKLLGPIAVCPGGQLEFEHAPPAANVAALQHLPPIWISGRAQLGSQVLVPARRS